MHGAAWRETPTVGLGRRELAVLGVLADRPGRVIGRSELRRHAGLDDLSPRRCEALIVGLRRVLGPNAIVTVRRRGWMLSADATAIAAAIVSGVGA